MTAIAIWLAIAAIIVPSITTLIAARLGVYWSIKANRDSATPAPNQPKQRIERAKRESHLRWKKLGAGLLGTSVPLALLIAAMSQPVSRWSVLAIAACIGWMTVQVAVSLSVYTVYRMWFSLKYAA